MIFLTFDEVDTSEITPWVLNQLEKYEAKATFVLGRIFEYPNVYQF